MSSAPPRHSDWADAAQQSEYESRSGCLAVQTLLSVARQRKGLDAGRCRVVFAHLDAAIAVRRALLQALASHRLTEVQFSALVALFALDPQPVTAGDLATYTGVSRTGLTEAVNRLESAGLLRRSREPADRRIWNVALTDHGRSITDSVLNAYLAAAGALARDVEPEAQEPLLAVYHGYQQRALEVAPSADADSTMSAPSTAPGGPSSRS